MWAKASDSAVRFMMMPRSSQARFHGMAAAMSHDVSGRSSSDCSMASRRSSWWASSSPTRRGSESKRCWWAGSTSLTTSALTRRSECM